MSLTMLGISTSPRKGGNSDLLLRQALAGAESAGARVECLRLCDFDIGLCTECNCCYSSGICRLEDDYQQVLEKMLHTDRLILATPIFFMAVCAQAKILIDRGQSLWALKHVIEKDIVADQPNRRAMVIAVGGSKSTKQFEGVRLTMKAYFDVLDFHYAFNLFVGRVDAFGAITRHPSALREALRLGRELASAETPPDKTMNVELF